MTLDNMAVSTYSNERQNLHSRLLDAVKACQTHLGGKQELVTEASSWISCLCTQFEAVLQHRMKPAVRGLAAIKHVTVGSSIDETTFWHFVKNHLTKHEVERFETLHNITTDVGRGRAWIRCSLNEHSLDRYFHMLLSDITLLRQYYESESFMLDDEKTSTLPQMAAGLGSIYFNIKYNDPSLDGSLNRQQMSFSTGFIPNLLSTASSNLLSRTEQPANDPSLEAQFSDKVKKRTGRKKRAKIISFGDEDACQGSITPADRGGPGFVVINPAFPKSNASVTSESSSGVFSTEGNTNGESKLNEIEPVPTDRGYQQQRPAELHRVPLSDTKELNRLASELSLNSALGNTEAKTTTIRNHDIHENIKESILQPPTDQKSFESGLSNVSSTPDKRIQSKQETKRKFRDPGQNSSGNIGQVTQHLMSVRHNSALDSHDLIMDDWSVRSNSTSGLMLPADNASAELYPVQDDYESESNETRSDILTNVDADTSASLVLSLAQKSSLSLWEKANTGRDVLDNMDKDNMTEAELRQALVALMHRKDEISEANKSMRTLLDSEMEHSAGLRLEIEKLQLTLKRQSEESASLQQQHTRENEVLRNQLKKYVGAVQALQRGEKSVEMPADPTRPSNNIVTEVTETEVYEKKLIEVAEMHGELMEFNERLHVRLQSAITLLHSMKAELFDLRGPMPHDELVSRIENDNLSGTVDNSPPLSRALINIWIPSSFLKGRSANTHHVFQVYVRIADEEWNIYRRYSHFHDLHIQLRKKFPIVDTYGFPPKKVMGNKGKKFVEDRRKGLQIYLRLLMNNVVQNHEKLVTKPDKQTLISLLPFFSESFNSKEKDSKKQKQGGAFHQQTRP